MSGSGMISSGKKKWLFCIWLLAFLGLGLSVELTRVYYLGYRDPEFDPVCAISEKMDCVSVALSPYSKILGLPNSIYGVFTYLLILALVPLRLKTKIKILEHLENYLFLLALFSVGLSVYLAYVSTFKIKSFCIWCTALYVVNLVFLVLAWLSLDRIKELWGQFKADFNLVRTDARVWGGLLGILVLVVVLMVILITRMEARRYRVVSSIPGQSQVEIEITGDPVIGPKDAPVTIVEFSDFQCPFCLKTHYVLKKMREKFGPRMRIVYKNFPLDTECNPMLKFQMHPNSCIASYAGECAYKNGCFESFYEKMVQTQRFDLESLLQIAIDCGMDPNKFQACLMSDLPRKAVLRDIEDAKKIGLKGTPTLIINGYVISGYRNEQEMTKIIKAFLEGKKPKAN